MIRISTAEKVVYTFLLFVAALLLLRFFYANSSRYLFLMWNLFLAWIPYQLSLAITAAPQLNKWITYVALCTWLIFFPNALYIITDLVHLGDSDGKAPIWFDAILLFTASAASLIMAFISLYQVELFFRRTIKPGHINKLMAAILFAGSFGVYLGRFLRWNSWDVITNPLSLLTEICNRFINPVYHYRAWFVTGLLTCLFSLLYFTIRYLPGLLQEKMIHNQQQRD